MEKIFFFLSLTFVCAYGNFYFITHASYRSLTYNTTGFAIFKIAGDVASVTQQCRRHCALKPRCAAFNLTLLYGSTELGVFLCRSFVLNTCNWRVLSLQNKSTSDVFDTLWEKLDADEDRKPKPCIEYCGVQYHGNCTACRGYKFLKGLDCDIAPRLCSDYPSPPSNWTLSPIWPWGFYGRMLTVMCRNGQTPLIIRNFFNGELDFRSAALPGLISSTNAAEYMNMVENLDWALLSELQALSTRKILTVYSPNGSVYSFSGFQLSPNGALTLNLSLDTPPSTGFPVPLYEVPFVKGSSASGNTCGPFWQFTPTVDVCSQRTNLLNFGDVKWDGVIFSSGVTGITFW